MAIANPLLDIIVAACSIKQINVALHMQLVGALKAYERSMLAAMMNADGNDLYRCQGKMKAAQELRRHVENCTELRDTFNRRDNNGRTTG